MSLLNEIGRIKSVMGLIKEEDSPLQMNVDLRKTVEVLKYLKIYILKSSYVKLAM